MPQKTATFIGLGDEEQCADVRKFVEDAGIRIIYRDLATKPLTVRELDRLFGHNPLSYFVNPASNEYKSLGLDTKTPERREMLVLLAENPGLLRRPIITTPRLLTVGCNKDKIAEMLQISRNGNQSEEINGNRGGKIQRRALPSRK